MTQIERLSTSPLIHTRLEPGDQSDRKPETVLNGFRIFAFIAHPAEAGL